MKLWLPGDPITDAPGSEQPTVVIDQVRGRVEIYASLDALQRLSRRGELDAFGQQLWRLCREAITSNNQGRLLAPGGRL